MPKRIKAQFWSFDLIFAMIISLFALVLLSFTWYNINSQLSLASGFGSGSLSMQAQAEGTQLLSQGRPVNWESVVDISNTLTWYNISIGIGNGTAGGISMNKLSTLEAMASYDYQATKEAMGTGYDYYIVLQGNSTSMSIGMNPQASKATDIQVFSEPVVVEGVPENIKIYIWTNSSFGIS
jgi:hypothetical protein